ncbi:MAG: thioredoxin domain-containing protein [Patescibacteria group bacterium]|nr:hypothetical protein [Patescibacteria group bacterium]
MPIIINHNLCDEAPECGGIEVCPKKAFYFDKKKQRVCVDHSKCTECLKCTLPDCCPVGCILYARNKSEEKRIRNRIKEDPRTAKWLWKERYGCQPGKTPPKAKIITDKNFDKVKITKGFKLIDIWHYDFLDCRAYSVLFEELCEEITKAPDIYKLDARKFPDISKKLRVKMLPALLLLKDEKEVYRFEGLLKDSMCRKVNKVIGSVLNNRK